MHSLVPSNFQRVLLSSAVVGEAVFRRSGFVEEVNGDMRQLVLASLWPGTDTRARPLPQLGCPKAGPVSRHCRRLGEPNAHTERGLPPGRGGGDDGGGGYHMLCRCRLRLSTERTSLVKRRASSTGSRLSSAMSRGSENHDLMGMALSG